MAFIDPSSHSKLPGWPLRNLLTLLHARFGVRRIQVLRWLDDLGTSAGNTQKQSKSLIATVVQPGQGLDSAVAASSKTIAATGWERNQSGVLAPKAADLGPLMDPSRLADQAVDLNLKLMRWRIMPEIDLEKIQGTKCLLFGAGTLGCYVARNLMVRPSVVVCVF